MCVFIRKFAKHIFLKLAFSCEAFFTATSLLQNLEENQKNNLGAVVDEDLSCVSVGIFKTPKHEKSQHQKIGDNKVVEKIMQNKLCQQQIWMLAENIIKHMYLTYNHQVIRN